MNKKKIKTFRLMAVCMAAAMVLNNSGMTVLATGLDGIGDDSEEIVILTEEDEGESVDADETEDDQDDVNDEDSEDGEDSEDDADDEDSEDGEDSEDDADDEDSEDGEDSEDDADDEDSEDGEDSEDDADDEDSEDGEDSEDDADDEDDEDEIDEEEPEDGEEIEAPDEEEADVLNASGTLSLTSDKMYSNAQLNGYDFIKLNGHKLTVSDNFTSTAKIETGENGELVVNGDMTTASEVRCDGGKLTVKGSYTQTNSWLCSNSGGGAVINISKNLVFKDKGYPYLYSRKDKVTIGGNLVYDSTYSSTDNDAVWTIKGNITQDSTAGTLRFSNLILAGTSGQTISMQENSELGNLTVNNSNVTLGTPYLSNVTLQTDFAPKGTVNVKTYTINLNGHKFTTPKGLENTGKILLGENGELTVNGDMTSSSEVNCQSGILTVKGSYTQTGNWLYAYSGGAVINISKNLVFKDKGYPYLYSRKDKVTVGGNLVYDSTYGTTDNGTIWTIKGNITQDSTAGALRFSNLTLAGTSGQTISLQENSELGNLTVNNSNVTLGTPYLSNVTLQTDFAPKGTVNVKTYTINLNGHKFTTPKGLENTGKILLGENGELVVNGDMTSSAEVRCDSAKLTVKGSYTQTNSWIYSYSGEGAEINISKNFVFKKTGYPYLYSRKDKVTVGGNFVYDSTYSSTDNGTVWTIKGNITQESGTDTLKFSNLILAGTTEQTISLQEKSELGNLTVKNSNVTLATPYLNNVTLQTDFAPKGTVTVNTKNFKLNGHKFTTPKGLESKEGIELGQNGVLTVNGDMTASGEVRCDGGKLTVKGKYTQTASRLYVENGAATISISKDAVFKPSGYIHIVSDEVKATVNGNMTYAAGFNTTSNKAEWTVKGNFTQGEGSAFFTARILKLPTKGTAISLYDGKVDTLVLGYGKKNYTITPENCYNKLIATCTLSFNANGGTVTTKNKKVTTEQQYGELPVPTKDGSSFEGWYTKKSGGDLVTAETLVTAVDDFTVYAHWKTKPVMNFDDVHESDWFYNAVKYVFENGIMAGVNGGKSFDPHGKLTREQFTQVLYAYEGKPELTTENEFTDVDLNAWYAKSVIWAKEKGIVAGKPDGTFGVGQNISRQDLAVMLYTYSRYKGYDLTANDDALDGFIDKGKVSSYAKNAMKWAVTQGVISGKGNGKVDPLGNATRAECATMVMKLFEKNK